jgi:hypothetical protein
MFDYHAAWLLVGLLIALPLINLLLRRRKITTTVQSSSSDEEEIRPAHIPKTYSWDDWIKDIYSAGVSTDLIMEKIRWCGMPKRPMPASTITGTTAAPVDITIGAPLQGGASIGIGGSVIGGAVYPNPLPPYNIYSAQNSNSCSFTHAAFGYKVIS